VKYLLLIHVSQVSESIFMFISRNRCIPLSKQRYTVICLNQTSMW